MSYVVVITGISGCEFYLNRCGSESEFKKDAKLFRSERAAKEASALHVSSLAPVISRHLSARVEVC
jgi:hypothetical protein